MRLATWLLALLSFGCSTARYSGPVSDHFDGQRFFNPGLKDQKSFFDVLKWKFTSTAAEWPEWVEIPKSNWVVKPKDEKTRAQVTFINHATLLIEWGDLNILTDPVFSKRTSPLTWAGPKRVKHPGLTIEELPKIHIVLVSHNHYDHLDIASLRTLHEKFQPQIYAPLGDCSIIRQIEGVKCDELDWGDDRKLGDINMHFRYCQHWSARTPWDRNRSLWGAYVLERGGRKIYFAADTGYGDHFKKMYEEFGAMDLSFLPIGAYEPRWFMKTNHMNPEEAVLAHQDLKSKKSVGIHYGTFQLTDEALEDPVNALKKALSDKRVPENDFLALENGTSFWME